MKANAVKSISLVTDWNKVWGFIFVFCFSLFILNLVAVSKASPPICITLILVMTAQSGHSADFDDCLIYFIITTGILALVSVGEALVGLKLKR